MSKSHPCPECGHTLDHLVSAMEHYTASGMRNQYRIKCAACGFTSPYLDSKTQAFSYWDALALRKLGSKTTQSSNSIRKIIQVACTSGDIIALCDDGTLWEADRQSAKWLRLELEGMRDGEINERKEND